MSGKAERGSRPRRHVPLRRCVACRTARAKGELTRLVRAPDGRIEVDASGKAPGRGAYVCRRRECVETAMRKQAVSRALGQPLPAQAARQMLEALSGGGEDVACG